MKIKISKLRQMIREVYKLGVADAEWSWLKDEELLVANDMLIERGYINKYFNANRKKSIETLWFMALIDAINSDTDKNVNSYMLNAWRNSKVEPWAMFNALINASVEISDLHIVNILHDIIEKLMPEVEKEEQEAIQLYNEVYQLIKDYRDGNMEINDPAFVMYNFRVGEIQRDLLNTIFEDAIKCIEAINQARDYKQGYTALFMLMTDVIKFNSPHLKSSEVCEIIVKHIPTPLIKS